MISFSEGRRAAELHPIRLDLDLDRPDRSIPDVHVLPQERRDLAGRQNEGILTGAQARLPEQELGQDTLNPDAGLGIGGRVVGLARPGQGPDQDEPHACPHQQGQED